MSDEPRPLSRRKLLVQVGAGVGAGLAGASLLSAMSDLKPAVEETPENSLPQPGDLLVLARGTTQGHLLSVDDVPVNAQQIFAWPMDPQSNIVRNGNSQNILLLVRAPSVDWYSQAEGPRTAGNVAAYSAVCTHLCCQVSDWIPGPQGEGQRDVLLCPCHKSHFDPWDGARVIDGPAPRPLPALPIGVNTQGELVVKSGFTGRVGCGS